MRGDALRIRHRRVGISAWNYLNRSAELIEEQRWAEALVDVRQAIALGCTPAFYNAALVYEGLGMKHASDKFVKKASSSNDVMGLFAHACLYWRNGRKHKAFQKMRKIFGVCSNDLPIGHAFFVQWNWEMRKDPNLISDLLAVRVHLPIVAVSIAEVYSVNGDISSARKALEEAVADGVHEAYLPLGNCLSDLGDDEAALCMYEKGADAGDAFSAFNAGLDFAKRGNIKEAKRRMRKAADGGDRCARKWLSWQRKQRQRTRRTQA